MENILTILKDFGPFGTLALSLVIIFYMYKKGQTIDSIADNHLSGLPEMTKTLERLENKADKQVELLIKIESKLK